MTIKDLEPRFHNTTRVSFTQTSAQLALFHLAVGDEHLPQVLEQTGPAEGAVGDGGAGHVGDGANTEQLVLWMAGEAAHQLTCGTERRRVGRDDEKNEGLCGMFRTGRNRLPAHPVGSDCRVHGSRP